jgi:hypothetical protein
MEFKMAISWFALSPDGIFPAVGALHSLVIAEAVFGSGGGFAQHSPSFRLRPGVADYFLR